MHADPKGPLDPAVRRRVGSVIALDTGKMFVSIDAEVDAEVERRNPTVPPAKPLHQPAAPRKRGRPPTADQQEDRKIFEAWDTGNYPTYAHLARELNSKPKLVEMAVDRHRKRRPPTE
jgi:hypothetical protein